MDKLTLNVESTLLIEFPRLNSGHRYRGRLLGYRSKHSVLVFIEGTETLSPLENDNCTVRYMDGQNACAFSTSVQRVCAEPFPYLHLYYPNSIEFVQLRAVQRFPVNLSATAILADGSTQPAAIVDISPQGLGFTAQSSLGEKGDTLKLNIDINNGEQKKQLAIDVSICNHQCKNSDDDSPQLHRYGATFFNNDPQQILSITELVFQNMFQARS